MITSFNLLNEKWLSVRYTGGETKLASLRECFKDAEKIESLDPPYWYGQKLIITDVPIMQFLSVIVMSAYFKKETGFLSKHTEDVIDDINANGIYNGTLKAYFDAFEDRFDLYSEDHPFLQNPILRPLLGNPDGDKYITRVNPFAPAENATLFGNIKTIASHGEGGLKAYAFDSVQFAYILLYLAAIGNSIMPANYPPSLGTLSTMYAVPQGRNLKETILLNLIDLSPDTAPTDEEPWVKADKPVWELDSYGEINEFDASNLYKNVLLMSFFPGINLLSEKPNEKGIIPNVARSTMRQFMITDISKTLHINDGKLSAEEKKAEKSRIETSKAALKTLSGQYVQMNPWAIKILKEVPVEKGSKEKMPVEDYHTYDSSHSAMSMCISSTEHLGPYNGCRVIESLDFDSLNVPIRIYYRKLYGMKTYYEFFGVHQVPTEAFRILKSEKGHADAVSYSNLIESIRGSLSASLVTFFGSSGNAETARDTAVRAFNFKAEEIFFDTLIRLEGNDDTSALKKAADSLAENACNIFNSLTGRRTCYVNKVKAYRDLKYSIGKAFKKEKINE